MTTHTHTRQPLQPLVSTGTRIATMFGVAALVACAWLGAQQESGKAVLAAASAMGPRPVYVTLPTVEIVGRRERGAGETALAANSEAPAACEL